MSNQKPEGAEEIAFHSLILIWQYRDMPLYLSDLGQLYKGLKFKSVMGTLDNLLKKKLITIDHRGIKLTKFD